MGEKTDSCNYVIIILLTFLFVVPVSCFILKKSGEPYNIVADVSELISAFIAALALVAAWTEYKKNQDSSEAQTLSYFNERYSNDISIRRVVKWCLYNMPNGNEEIVRPNNYNIDNMLYEKEMFMRFFEELELSLEKKNLTDEQAVFDTFAYYALRVSRFKDFVYGYTFHVKGVFQYNKANETEWKYFEKFIHRMSKFEK